MHQLYKLFIFKAKHKNMCFMIPEILKYENIFILMEKMGKQYSPFEIPQQCLEILCRGLGRVVFKFVTVT